jgi:hypothetical protein
MIIKSEFQVAKPEELSPGTVYELPMNGFATFALAISGPGKSIAVTLYSKDPDFFPTVVPRDGPWNEECLVYPHAMLEIIRTEHLVLGNSAPVDWKGVLKISGGRTMLRAKDISVAHPRYWIDLKSAEFARDESYAAFYATHWRLWASDADKAAIESRPLVDFAAAGHQPR